MHCNTQFAERSALDLWDSNSGAGLQEMGFAKTVDLEDVLDRCAVTPRDLVNGLTATYPVMNHLCLSRSRRGRYLSDGNNRGRGAIDG